LIFVNSIGIRKEIYNHLIHQVRKKKTNVILRKKAKMIKVNYQVLQIYRL